MHCKHCGFACTSKGKDMPKKIWKQAIKLALNYDSAISIGGGEPTIHPEFWEIMGVAMGSSREDGYVWLATNGSQTDTSIALAGLAKKGVIGCALSQDEWHDPIDNKVIQAFTKDKKSYSSYDNHTPDAREIRRTVDPVKSGRCKDGRKGCVCEDLVIEPDGKIRACGCSEAKVLGDVFNFKLPEDYQFGECSCKK